MPTIVATRIGGHAYRYLTAQSRTGSVASTFRHGFNVLFHEESDPGFVSIQSQGVALHPWAVQARSLLELSENEPVLAESGRLRFRGGWTLDVSAAAVDELRIKPHASEEGERALSRLPILKKLLEEEWAKRDLDPFRPEIDAILKRWKETGNSNVLLDLVGLGSGSTPSGDDVWVGMLAGFTAFERVSDGAEVSLLGLRAALRTDEKGTSLPSAQTLAAAADGSVPEPVLAVLSALASESDRDVRKATLLLASQGATSGLEMLAGILQALEDLDLGSGRSERRRDGHGV